TASSSDEAASFAEKIGFPIVLKLYSKTITHKSDVGGVAVNIQDAQEAAGVAETMNKNLGDGIKFFIQKFLPKGQELIIGAKAVKGVGHTIMFGLGGIFVEILKDVAFAITPVSDTEAMEMISSIQAAPIIDGFRGEKGINKGKAIEIIQRISMLGTNFLEIKELDLNPLFAIGDEICVVDARMIL
ncbi:MAG: acetate--CoA ligase family protein, partial [Bacteroidia bacterium]|nr:acetate--CoA ligase family protein [Bacteroidia bacterium]